MEYSIDVKELLDLLLKVGDHANFYWNFYIVGVVAITGWLLTRNNPLRLPVQIIITVAYLCLSVLNLFVLTDLFSFQNDIALELKAQTIRESFATDPLYERICAMNFRRAIWITWIFHVVIDSSMLVMLWNRKIWVYLRAKDIGLSDKEVQPNQ